jgi:hypothetical protein
MGYIIEFRAVSTILTDHKSHYDYTNGGWMRSGNVFDTLQEAKAEIAAQTDRFVYRVVYIDEGSKPLAGMDDVVQPVVDPVALTMELLIERMQNRLNAYRNGMLRMLKVHSANTETLLNKVNAQLEASQAEVTRLDKIISDDKRPVIYLAQSEPEPYQFLSVKGWVVVDTTWKRGPLHLCPQGWLGTASETFQTTVFASEADAQQAIEDTHDFKGMSGGPFAWQSNNYVAVEIHKQQ